jgi:type II secretory pathway component GspD/PulD (secretin)
MRYVLGTFVLAAGCATALAQGALEVIPLRHRTAEQVLPALRPFLEPGGTLSAHGNQLIVRTSPVNLSELRAALAAIDTPQRRLVIHVRYGGSASGGRRSLGADVNVTLGERPDARARAHGFEARSGSEERADQTIQVLDGGRAFIAVGTTRPLAQRQVVRTPGGVVTAQTTTLQELQNGFDVVPRAVGDGVVLEIAERRETPGVAPGVAQVQRLATTIRARLGEWVELGGVGSDTTRDDRGVLRSADSSVSDERRVWVKVEEIGP